MSLPELTSLIEQYGIGGALLISVLFIIITLAKGKWLSEALSKISDKFIEKSIKNKTKNVSNVSDISESNIYNHDIFNYIDFWMYSKVPTLQFSTEYRTYVFRKYLTLYLNSYKKNLLNFIEDKTYQDMDDAKLSTTLLNMMNKIIYDYERESELAGIPKIVIEKMKLKNNDTIVLTLDLIEGICSSQFYTSEKNLLKVFSMLNILLSVLENTISNSENICNSINGQLKGLVYKDGDRDIIEP